MITLSRSLIVPFLTFSERRDLREQAWRAWVGRGEHAGEHDNRPVARDILDLRSEQAALHGHASYADYALTDTMAGTRAAVHQLLDEVWPRALAAVEREREELLQVMREHAGADAAHRSLGLALLGREGAPAALCARRRGDQALLPAAARGAGRLRLRAAPVRPAASRARDDLPVYHPDVKAYEVRDAAGAVVAIFLQDNFARATKRSGAWMSTLRWQSRNEPGGGSGDRR